MYRSCGYKRARAYPFPSFVLQASIPVEENLQSNFDAMHVTEFWRLEKQQFLELYAAWSASTDDPGTIFCPG